MKVLVVGSGGREHALVWKIAQSKKVTAIYCAPGNGGIGEIANCVDIKATDLEGLRDFAIKENIDLTVVGMDDPLVMGIVDYFEEKGLAIFGPRKNAAIIEGSKEFSKQLMKKYHIPTADYAAFQDFEKAKAYIASITPPYVVKADGLALGKGVIICQTQDEALTALEDMMLHQKFGEAGKTVVIEEFMTGPEVSVLSFCDGKNVIPMISAQDHKRALDHDEGLNTGGMGTFAPSPLYTQAVADYCMEHIYVPTIRALQAEGRPFTGILYFGLMLTKDGPKVLEYNARFGDPEAQVVLPLLKTDLVSIFEHAIQGTLDKIEIEWRSGGAVCVILASGGYPEKYETGYPIEGLDKVKNNPQVQIFHAGTRQKDGQLVTSGGRVLGVTGIGESLENAIEIAYTSVKDITFPHVHYRTDIGRKEY